MIRVWEYVEPGDDGVTPVFIRMNDDEILKEYYDYWESQMINKFGPSVEISSEMCIEDWCIINWAQQIFNWDVE